jgi:ribosome maturation factor RimP
LEGTVVPSFIELTIFMIDASVIEKLALEKLKDSELFLADVVVKPDNRIHVFLDGDRDVTIDDCATLSRHLNASLPDEENFELMVSSCGADRPIKLPRQFKKHLGRSINVILSEEKPFSGILEGIDDKGMTLRLPRPKKKKKGDPELPETVYVLFEKLESAKVNISFNK